MDINVIFVNHNTIGSFFRFKDNVPVICQSSVVYSFCCASCDASYIGSTKRSLHCRIEQHRGRSYRTGIWLSKPDPSPIRSHGEQCNPDISIDNFKILDRECNLGDLRILESMYIMKNNPSLNDNTTAVKLNVIV